MGLFKRTTVKEDATISLTDESHAWWSERDELSKVFVPKKRRGRHADEQVTSGEGTEQDSGPSFTERYSSESLFNWAASDSPDDPTVGGRGNPLDPYGVLGLQPGASLSEVVAAHRTLAKRFHPDQHHNSTDDEQRGARREQMTMVNAAYQELRSRLLVHRHTV